MKDKFITANFYYLSSQVILLVLSVIQGLIVPKLLGPSDYGLYGIVILIITYSKISHLGILNAFDREYPKMTAKGFTGETENFRNSCFTFTFMTGVCFSLGVLAYVFIGYGSRGLLPAVMALLALSLIFDNVNEFNIISFRTNRRFGLLSLNRLAGKTGLTALTVVLAYLYGLKGALLAIVLCNLGINVFFLINSDRPALRIDWKVIRRTMSLGLSLYLLVILSIVLATFDRIFVSNFFPRDQFGIYNLGCSITSMAMVFTSSTAYVLFPFMLDKLGRTGEITELLNHFEKPLYVVSFIVPVFLSLLYIFCDFFIPFYFPKYRDLMTYLPFLFVAVFFLSFSYVPDTFLVSTNAQKTVLRNQLITIAFGIAGFSLIFFSGKRVMCVAGWTAAYMSLYSILAFFSGAGKLYRSSVVVNRFVNLCLAPLLTFSGVTYFLSTCVNAQNALFPCSGFSNMIIRMAVILIISAPFFWVVNRKIHLTEKLVGFIAKPEGKTAD